MVSNSFRRIFHWGPLIALGIIKLITWALVHMLGMWWPPEASVGGAIHAMMFLFLAASTLYYFLQAFLEGPGFLPAGWKPKREEDKEYLQYCTVCKGYKAPRSHHCKKCGHCVLKMDHHCPWINSCVGHANHSYFILFLTFAVLGCLHAVIVLSIGIYHAMNRVWYVRSNSDYPIIYLTLTTLVLTLLAIGMAVGVVLAVGVLLYLQVRGVMRNCTTIEEWIIEKAVSRREEHGLPLFIFPYDLGWKSNLKSVFRNSGYDGITWPIKDGCTEYDLTSEQQAQKADKRVRARWFQCSHGYSGRWFPLWSWPCAALHPPCSDETRLLLQPGDRVLATRHRRHWLFGEKISDDTDRGPRGWFPRDAVIPCQEFKTKPD